MRLFAVSDLHLGHEANREAMDDIRARPDDWLILAGDVAEKNDHIRFAFEHFGRKFKRLAWVPGNHELWTRPGTKIARGVDRYEELVSLAREYDVLTPEDAYPVLDLTDGPVRLCPLFLLYDYSFRPDDIRLEDAVAWARESGVLCSDEFFLSPRPFSSRGEWCRARVETTRTRLDALDDDLPTVLVSHWPLRRDVARTPRVPRFSIWCGTVETEEWHRRYRARAVVSGHIHIPSSRLIDGVRFEEVSFGYPKQWQGRRPHPDLAVREIVPE
ncbi:metallophosphoesterase [Fulvimarina sp. 2208YS6-2-32]|uniref:Metallophosphoesterase n=1 Tax=Fulvimarina uroteuthidis TaxID=3098149 RepID=A0ABU5HXN1_9HYPH|nr:metallophosphoesterase [Fulvimarina sp. 2208YS6-2-32]MDY8107637.1 metallophosphoesterase [Fulvimarina sp. 2208YS6-2-32]